MFGVRNWCADGCKLEGSRWVHRVIMVIFVSFGWARTSPPSIRLLFTLATRFQLHLFQFHFNSFNHDHSNAPFYPLRTTWIECQWASGLNWFWFAAAAALVLRSFSVQRYGFSACLDDIIKFSLMENRYRFGAKRISNSKGTLQIVIKWNHYNWSEINCVGVAWWSAWERKTPFNYNDFICWFAVNKRKQQQQDQHSV